MIAKDRDPYVAIDGMIAGDNARMREAGGKLAEAAVHVITHHDGLHRLSLAVAEWCNAIAAEGGRPHPRQEADQ